jgi:hypothetical protein
MNPWIPKGNTSAKLISITAALEQPGLQFVSADLQHKQKNTLASDQK